jgi:hypothetical protein
MVEGRTDQALDYWRAGARVANQLRMPLEASLCRAAAASGSSVGFSTT